MSFFAASVSFLVWAHKERQKSSTATVAGRQFISVNHHAPHCMGYSRFLGQTYASKVISGAFPKTTSLGDSTNIRKTGSMDATCYLCPPSYLTGLMQAANRSGSRVPSSAAREIKWPGDCLYMDVIWHMEFIFWIWPVFREVSGKWGLYQQLTALHCHAMRSGRCSLLALSLLIFCIDPRLLLQRNMLSKKKCNERNTLLHIAFHKNLRCGFQLQVGLRGHLFSQEAFRLTFLQPPSFWDSTLETKANVLYIYNVHLYVYIYINVHILYIHLIYISIY